MKATTAGCYRFSHGAPKRVLVILSALHATSAVAGSTPPSAPAGQRSSPPQTNALQGSVALDPLGFALFGPTASVELGIGHWSGVVAFRWLSPGAIANQLFLQSGDAFAFSYGLAARGQYYFSRQLSGFHVGVSLEYLHADVENEERLISSSSHYIIPQVDGGYRYRLGMFFLGGAASFGYAARIAGSVENLPGGTRARLYSASDESSIYASARLELGIYF